MPRAVFNFVNQPLDHDEASRLKALQEAAILDTLPESVFDDLVDWAAEVCGTRCAAIAFIDRDRQWFKARRNLDLSETPRDVAFCAQAGPDPAALLEVPDTREDPRFRRNPLVTEDPHIRFYAGAPILAREGHAMGTLCVSDPAPKHLTDTQRRALRRLAGQAAELIHTRRLISQQRRTQEALDAAHVELREVVNQLAELQFALDEHAIVGVTDAAGRITYVNDRFCAISRYSRDELLGQDHRIINSGYHGKDFFRQLWATISQGRVWRGDIHNKAKDGSRYWVATTIVPLLDGAGKPRRYIAIRADITDRKQAEAAQRESELFALATLDSLSAHIAIVDEHGVIIAVNGRWRAFAGDNPLVGFKACEGADYLAICKAVDGVEAVHAQAVARGVRNVLSGATPEFIHEYACHSTTRQSWFAVRVTRFAGGGVARAVVTHEDVTALKRAELEAHERHQRFEKIFRSSPSAISVTRISDGEFIDVNTRYCDLVGYTREELLRLSAVQIRLWERAEERTQYIRRLLAEGSIRDIHTRLRTKSGRLRDVIVSLELLNAAEGAVGSMISQFDDITDRLMAETQLREGEQRYRLLVETSSEGIVRIDRQARITYANSQMGRMFGYAPDEMLGRHLHELLNSGELEQIDKHLENRRDGASERYEIPHQRRDGTTVWTLVSTNPLMLADGTIDGAVAMFADITHEKESEARLEHERAQLAAVLNACPVGIIMAAPGGRVLHMNPANAKLWGSTAPFARSVDEYGDWKGWWADGTPRHGRRVEPHEWAMARALRGETVPGDIVEIEPFDARGTRRTMLNCGAPIRDGAGLILGAVIAQLDITERRRTEIALQKSQQDLERAQGLAHIGSWRAEAGEDGRLVWSPEMHRIFGIPPEDFLGRQACFRARVHPDDRSRLESATQAAWAGQAPLLIEHRIVRPDGDIRWVQQRAEWELNADGTVAALLGVTHDITPQHRAAAALQESEQRFRELAETIDDVFWVTDPGKNSILYLSPAYEKIWGRPCLSVLESPRSWLEAIHHEDRDRVIQAAMERQVLGTYNEEYRIVRPDGLVRWIRDRAFPVRNAAGHVARVVGVARDVTDLRQLEDQFRQVQKMEAIGQLAGGIAHDFNNILGVIVMQVGLARLSQDLSDEVLESLREIQGAAERATNLTRQLLLFSRRQVLQPRVLDLNDLVTSLAKMLQRIIGEDVRLHLRLDSKPLQTWADAGMLDQVLLNLAVNARDAMPQGGELSIETGVVRLDHAGARSRPGVNPGDYVWLRVHDTGTGIPPEVLPRIFEPFFSTKEPGKGTGLGLATVFGIVKQHHGWIEVTSQPGHGSTFSVHVPARKHSESVQVFESNMDLGKGGSGETLLIVEDEDALRRALCSVLRQRGYRVLEAASGVDALRIWSNHSGEVHLVITDIVMPGGINGQELARQLKAERPGLKVIFTSGYSRQHAGKEIELRDNEVFLQKPAQAALLLETVRQSLDRQTW